VREFFKWIFEELLGIPARLLQVVVSIFPFTDHFRFNIVADLIALVSVYLLANKLPIPLQYQKWWIFSIPVLLFFFAWCFRTSLITKRR
jgi:hypothetical protein